MPPKKATKETKKETKGEGSSKGGKDDKKGGGTSVKVSLSLLAHCENRVLLNHSSSGETHSL